MIVNKQIEFNGDVIDVSFDNELTAARKLMIVEDVLAALITDSETSSNMKIEVEDEIKTLRRTARIKRYQSIIRNMIFDYTLIKNLTGVRLTRDENEMEGTDTTLQELADMEILTTGTNLAEIIKDELGEKVVRELNKAIDDNVQFITGIKPYSIEDEIGQLLNAITEKVAQFNIEDVQEFMGMFKNVDPKEFTAEKALEVYSKSTLAQRTVEKDRKESEKRIKSFKDFAEAYAENEAAENETFEQTSVLHEELLKSQKAEEDKKDKVIELKPVIEEEEEEEIKDKE